MDLTVNIIRVTFSPRVFVILLTRKKSQETTKDMFKHKSLKGLSNVKMLLFRVTA